MTRIKNNFDLLVEDLYQAQQRARRVDKTAPAGKVARSRPTNLGKSRIVDWNAALLKAQADGTLKTVAVKLGTKKPAKPAALPNMNDASVPTALRHQALKQAIVAHASANDNLNSPISEPMLNRVLKMAKAGQLTNDQARRTVEYHSKGLALPTDVMRAIASNS
ncbi:hypothetical protein [Paraburkholderia terrae]